MLGTQTGNHVEGPCLAFQDLEASLPLEPKVAETLGEGTHESPGASRWRLWAICIVHILAYEESTARPHMNRTMAVLCSALS